jgi:hypothetical protein
MKIFFSKKALDYSLIILFIVIVTIPVLYWRMTSKVEETKKAMGEGQAILLRAPYAKEDTITYIQKAAELEIQAILTEASTEIPKLSCDANIMDTFNKIFNEHLSSYIKEYNRNSQAKLPENNYEIYLEGNNIHSIAILPVKKSIAKPPGELEVIGTMWFAPSFTITIKKEQTQYQNVITAMNQKLQACI